MIKNKEEILQEKAEQIYSELSEYIDKMDNLSDTKEFTIDRIEKLWDELEISTKQIYREINAEIIKRLDERSIIKDKKKSTRKKE